ncbi:MAG: hypothetical protein JO331_10525 [Verrucomicrobia bacterium]|nr:hypothetical protein [Verrucomicrobiota bacterium]
MMATRFPHLSGLLSVLLFLVANICQARIGDTLEEAIQRYGKVVSKASAGEFAMFKEPSYYITAHFHDGETDAITYVKTGSESSTKGSFSDDEIEMLLRINGNGQTWERSKANARLNKWRTEDGKIRAVYSESKFLVITTAGYLKRLEDAAKEKKRAPEEKKRKGSPISQKHQTTSKKKFSPSARKSSFAPAGHGD